MEERIERRVRSASLDTVDSGMTSGTTIAITARAQRLRFWLDNTSSRMIIACLLLGRRRLSDYSCLTVGLKVSIAAVAVLSDCDD